MNEELSRKVLECAGININEKAIVNFIDEDSPGLGYSSLLQRFKISFVQEGSKDCQTLYCILKSNPDVDHPPDSLFDKMFSCETKVYQNILLDFEKIFSMSGNSIIWPKLFTISKDNQIAMEDLKPLNYRTNFEEGGSNYQEAVIAINSLAKFHGASIVIKSEGKKIDQVLEPYFYCRNDEINNKFFKDGLRLLVATMRQSWGNSWSYLADKIEKISNQLGDTFVNLNVETDDKFKVINHGDFWRANLLYQFDDNNTPISFKFVDFQLSHYGSIGWDLAYFLYLNPNLNLRYSHRDDLLKIYQIQLASFLESCNCSTVALSLEEINQEFSRFQLYGFLKCCTDLPYQICSYEGGVDAENLFTYTEETEKLKMKIYSSDKYTEIIKTHLNYLAKNNII